MIPWKQLSPPSGSKPMFKIKLVNLKKQPASLLVKTFDFSVDEENAKGTGSMELMYDPTEYMNIKSNDEFLISLGWKHPDGSTSSFKPFINGFFEDVKFKPDTITVTLVDKGKELEQENTVDYTNMLRSEIMEDIIKKANLIPKVNFGPVKNDIISYHSAVKNNANQDQNNIPTTDTVRGAGAKSCRFCDLKASGANTRYWYTSVVKNECPECHKKGTIVWVQGEDYHWCSKEDPYPDDGMYVCCARKGGCDSDWCICGHNHTAKYKSITVVEPPTPCDKPITLSFNAEAQNITPVDQNDEGTTDTSSKSTYWDMLLELCDQVNLNLQVFVWMDTVYVHPVPFPKDYTLRIDSKQNLLYNTLSLEEGEGSCVNTVVIAYTQNPVPFNLKVSDPFLVKKYGEDILRLNQPNLDQGEAYQTAIAELGRAIGKAKFKIECEVLGHPDWYICRFAYVNYTNKNLNSPYYISRVNHKVGANTPYTVELTLLENRPIIKEPKEEEKAEGVGTFGEMGTTPEEIFRWIKAHVPYVLYMDHRAGHDPESLMKDPKLGGNCWDQSNLFAAAVNALPNGQDNARTVCGKRCGGLPHCNVHMDRGNGVMVVVDVTCSKLNQLQV